MIFSLGCIAVFAVLIALASLIEVPVGRGLGSVQLNLLIRLGSFAAAGVALIAVDGARLPLSPYLVGGLGIGVLTGVGSILYCLSLIELPLSMVVTLSNCYLLITMALGVSVLHESVTLLKAAGVVAILGGVVLLAYPPSSRYGVHSAASTARKPPPLRALVTIGVYVVVIGVGAFLEKPALLGLDAVQLNGLMAFAMTVVAAIAFVIEGPVLPVTTRSLGVLGVGAMIGLASVFYFLGLRGLPVSVAAASSNSSIVITVLLSALVLRQPLSKVRGGAIGLTIVGLTLLALGAS